MENKIKLLVLDFDGTSCHFDNGNFGSSWDAFTSVCGVYDELHSLLKKYYFQHEKEEFMTREAGKLFRGKPISLVESLRPIPYSDGLKDFLNSRNGNGIKIGFLSSGINIVVNEAASELNLDFSLSTELKSNRGFLTGEVGKIISLWNKEKFLYELLDNYSLSLNDLCYVGDNDNDISCLKLAKIGVAFNPKTEKTRRSADYIISDFRELKNILNN